MLNVHRITILLSMAQSYYREAYPDSSSLLVTALDLAMHSLHALAGPGIVAIDSMVDTQLTFDNPVSYYR